MQCVCVEVGADEVVLVVCVALGLAPELFEGVVGVERGFLQDGGGDLVGEGVGDVRVVDGGVVEGEDGVAVAVDGDVFGSAGKGDWEGKGG